MEDIPIEENLFPILEGLGYTKEEIDKFFYWYSSKKIGDELSDEEIMELILKMYNDLFRRRKNLFKEGKPSEVTESPWLWADRETNDYPESTNYSGKWMIYEYPQNIDETWEKIKNATIKGRLGGSSKVATNINSTERVKVICVYTYDYRDNEHVFLKKKALLTNPIRFTQNIYHYFTKVTYGSI